MHSRGERREDGGLQSLLLVAILGLGVLAVVLALVEPALLALVAVPALTVLLLFRRARSGVGLQVHQMERLRQASQPPHNPLSPEKTPSVH